MAARGLEDRLVGWLEDPRRVLLAAVIVIALPVLVLGEVSASDTRGRTRQAGLDGAAATADRASSILSDHLDKSAQVTSAVAGAFDVQNALQARDLSILRSRANELRAALGADAADVAVVDAAGRALDGAPSAATAISAYFKAAKERQRTSIGVVDAPPGGSQRIAIAVPVRRSIDPFIGAIVVEIPIAGDWWGRRRHRGGTSATHPGCPPS